MVLQEDELDKIRLMLIDNNKALIKDLKESFVEKQTMWKALVIVALVAIGVSIPNIGPLLALIP